MALAKPVTHVLDVMRSAATSVFAVHGTVLPPNLLLMAKLITLCYLLTQWRDFPVVFLPFFGPLDALGEPVALKLALQLLFLVAAGALFANRSVRLACLGLALVIVATVLSSRMYFGNNRVYSACLLFLTALYTPGAGIHLVRYQIVLLYLGAGLNKLLDADWRSGQFFETWTATVPHWSSLRAHLSELPDSRALSWLVIVTELALAIGFAVPRLFRLAIWLGVAYHTAILIDTSSTFNMFYFAALSSYLAFVNWPSAPIQVYDDGTSALIGGMRSAVRRADLEGRIHWSTIRPPGHPSSTVSASPIQVSIGNQTLVGWAALTAVWLSIPLTYFAFAAALCAMWLGHGAFVRWLALAGVLLCSPLLTAAGDLVLRLFSGARDRVQPVTE
jgi:hypothetical protein